MATLMGGPKPADLFGIFPNNGVLDLAGGSVTAATAALYRITLGTRRYDFTGTFTYDPAGHLDDGTITGWTFVTPASQFTLTGLSISVATFFALLDAADTPGFLDEFLGGNDSMTGAALGDALDGFGGDDTINGAGGDDVITGNDGNDSLLGGAGDDTLEGAAADDTMAGGVGDDVYIVSDLTDAVTEEAGKGDDTILSEVGIDLSGSLGLLNVENLVLIGPGNFSGIGNALDNLITGDAGDDTLSGNDGDDSLFGGVGADAMTGGKGDDVYEVDNAGDTVTENKDEGDDTIFSSVDYDLSKATPEVENLALLAGATKGTGNALDNIIIGSGSHDTLDGGDGADTLVGGLGDDFLRVASTGDKVIELANGGEDFVESLLADYTLGANLEHLLLSAGAFTGTGNALNNGIFGNDKDNKLVGLGGHDGLFGDDGNDTLDGGAGDDSLIGDKTGGTGDDSLIGGAGIDALTGGLGNDTLAGGAGNDFYTLEDKNAKIVELAGQGIDLVTSFVDVAELADNVENLALVNSADEGKGNKLNNLITGSNIDTTLDGGLGNDTLNGAGGVDVLIGGLGNDVYTIEDIGDKAVENTKGGIDTVHALVDITALNDEVENLVLIGNINGKGNALNNVITGSSAKNSIDGLGGADTMAGGDGDDSYTVDSAKDKVVELLNKGFDAVSSSVDHTLAIYVEQLNLQDGAAITGIGNAHDNKIIGNTNANKLFGLGGNDKVFGFAGNDTIDGGAGNDTLDGDAGDDSLIGGAGNDTLAFDGDNDILVGGTGDDLYDQYTGKGKIVEASGGGTDTLVSQEDIFALDKYVENLVLVTGVVTGVGNTLNNKITGDDAAQVLEGKEGNDTLIGGLGADKMTGGIGNDTYEVDDGGDVVTEAAGKGEGIDTIRSSISFDLGADGDNVENLTLLDKATTATGNGFNNVITGNEGDNTLKGGDGIDTLLGGKGNDFYFVDSKTDKLIELANQGVDIVQSSADHVLAANLDHLVLADGAINGTGNGITNSITGNTANNKLLGLAANDELSGGDGSDTLDGGSETDTLNGDAGNDSLIGGAGNDVLDGGKDVDKMAGGAGNDGYVIDDVNDAVFEVAGQGIDVVFSTVDVVALAANVENLKLQTLDLIGGGNGLNNEITGGVGKDTLSGFAGNDTLVAGAGNDSVNGGEGNDSLFGEGGDDTLIGGNGNDTLIAGLGTDVLQGDAGNDVYVIGTGTKIVELGGGTDTIRSVNDFDLGLSVDTANIENLILDDAAVSGKGNGLNNVITGNTFGNDLQGFGGKDSLVGGAGDDTLDGGIGSDTMAGGKDNDSYKIDDAGDKIVELAGQGDDSVESEINYTMAVNLEQLFLTGSAIVGIGNADINTITGNVQNNKLSGLGGADDLLGDAGSDTLDGGIGEDNLFGGADNDSLIGGAGDDGLSGDAGDDTMIGGAGDDFYMVDSKLDQTTELAGQGIDVVRTTVSGLTLAKNVENLELSTVGIATGNELNNRMINLGGDGTLDGGAGNDTLLGGFGSDELTGGSGRDRFEFVGNVADMDITDFQAGVGGDILDISVLLPGYDAGTDNPNDFVRFVGSGLDTKVQVDKDGTDNGVNFVDAVLLLNVTLTSVDQAIIEGNLELD